MTSFSRPFPSHSISSSSSSPHSMPPPIDRTPSSSSTLPLPSILPDEHPLLRACKRGQTSTVLSLLSPLPSSLLTSLLNTPDASGSTPLFHATQHGHSSTLSLLLSLGANPNHQNTQHNTPLHTACQRGQEGPLLILLSHDASPHLLNCHGQRCYEMTGGGRERRVRMEALVKSVWHDLRKAKEAQLMGGGVGGGEGEGEGGAGGGRPGTGEAGKKRSTTLSLRLPARSHRDWYQEQHSVEGVKRLLQPATTPLLSSALQWKGGVGREAEAGGVGDEGESGGAGVDEGSLIRVLDERVKEELEGEGERRRVRGLVRAGGVKGERMRGLLREARVTWLAEDRRRREERVQEEERVRRERRGKVDAEGKQRVWEVRAVMKESGEGEGPKGKRARVLRQVKRGTLWMIEEEERRERKAEAERRARGEGAAVFMTELEVEEADPLPSQQGDGGGEEGQGQRRRRAVEEDPQHFPAVQVKAHTRAYIHRTLTEQFTLIPPPPELQPAEVVPPPAKVTQPPLRMMRREGGQGNGEQREREVVWRDVGWNVVEEGDEEAKVQVERGGGRRGRRSRLSGAGGGRASPMDGRERGEEERKEQAILSSLIMQDMQAMQLRATSPERRSREEEWEAKRRVIEEAMPGLSPSSSLYRSLITADPLLVPVAAKGPRQAAAAAWLPVDGGLPTDEALSTLMAKHSLMLHHTDKQTS